MKYPEIDGISDEAVEEFFYIALVTVGFMPNVNMHEPANEQEGRFLALRREHFLQHPKARVPTYYMLSEYSDWCREKAGMEPAPQVWR